VVARAPQRNPLLVDVTCELDTTDVSPTADVGSVEFTAVTSFSDVVGRPWTSIAGPGSIRAGYQPKDLRDTP
jgi:hypothetical protein